MATERLEHIEDILNKQDSLESEKIYCCFSTLKQLITAADDRETNSAKTESETIYADYSDDQEQFHAQDSTENCESNYVKWTIRVRAFKCVHRIFNLFASNNSAVVRILPDLVRISFIAATSPYDDLKIQGFIMFRELINRFALVEEKEFPGHSILEQFKTQILTALRPSFNLDAPPYITAIACQVCCQWLCRGLEKEPLGLKRVYLLMEPSIEKLESQGTNPNSLLYHEIELEQERLDILGSWAQLYETSETNEVLKDLIKDRVDSLVDKWWEASKDYALLIIPSPKRSTILSYDNEHVCTKEVALNLFTPIWPRIILALTLRLCASPDNIISKKKPIQFICGLLMHDFCKLQEPTALESLPESTILALRSLSLLLSSEITVESLVDEASVAREFYSILGRILLMTNLKSSHKLVLKRTLSQILEVVLGRFQDNNETMRYSLAQLMERIKIGTRLSETRGQIIFNTLILVAKSRPKLLVDDSKLLNMFTKLISKILEGGSSPTTTIFVVDSLQNLTKTEGTTAITKQVFATKQCLLIELLNTRPNDKPSKICFDAVIRSMEVDLELLTGSERQDMFASMIKALLTNLDPSKDDKDLINQTIQILKDLERKFVEEFACLRKSGLRSMIDDALKPVTENEKDSKTSKKKGTTVNKQPRTIVLKSDFSNFYSKK